MDGTEDHGQMPQPPVWMQGIAVKACSIAGYALYAQVKAQVTAI